MSPHAVIELRQGSVLSYVFCSARMGRKHQLEQPRGCSKFTAAENRRTTAQLHHYTSLLQHSPYTGWHRSRLCQFCASWEFFARGICHWPFLDGILPLCNAWAAQFVLDNLNQRTTIGRSQIDAIICAHNSAAMVSWKCTIRYLVVASLKMWLIELSSSPLFLPQKQ